jgi:hypothetical protein
MYTSLQCQNTRKKNTTAHNTSLLDYVPRFEKKIKGGLWDHLAVCLCILLCLYLPNVLGLEAYVRTLISLCLCPSYFLVFHAVRLVSKEDRQLILPKISIPGDDHESMKLHWRLYCIHIYIMQRLWLPRHPLALSSLPAPEDNAQCERAVSIQYAGFRTLPPTASPPRKPEFPWLFPRTGVQSSYGSSRTC